MKRLVVMSLLLVGCGAQTVVVKPAKSTNRVVLYVHGADETAKSSFTDPEKKPVFAALLKAGFAIATDNAGGNNWGDASSVSDYEKFITQLRKKGLTRVYILAQSMGGLDGLALLKAERVEAWAGIYPICNARSIYRLGTYSSQIRAVYPDVIPGPVKVTNVKGLPMRFWSSPQDVVAPKRFNTDICAAEARRAGALVTVTSTHGNHGDPSNFQPAAIVKLFRRGGEAGCRC